MPSSKNELHKEQCYILSAQQDATVNGKEYINLKLRINSEFQPIDSVIWFRKANPDAGYEVEGMDKATYYKLAKLVGMSLPATANDVTTDLMNKHYDLLVAKLNAYAEKDRPITLPIEIKPSFSNPNVNVKEVNWYKWSNEYRSYGNKRK